MRFDEIQNPDLLARDIGNAVAGVLTKHFKHQKSQRTAEEKEKMYREVMTIVNRLASLPVLDTRSEDEILGYDEHGIPT